MKQVLRIVAIAIFLAGFIAALLTNPRSPALPSHQSTTVSVPVPSWPWK